VSEVFKLSQWPRIGRGVITRRRIKQRLTKFFPETKPLGQAPTLRAVDFASVMLGHKVGQVGNNCRVLLLSKALCIAADRYYAAAEAELSMARRGRPSFRADYVFIDCMARIFRAWINRSDFGWRRFRRGYSHHGSGGGREEPTAFQTFCELWLLEIDPERERPLQPAAFKNAKKAFGGRRRIKNLTAWNKIHTSDLCVKGYDFSRQR
jgi:hypothetical protein